METTNQTTVLFDEPPKKMPGMLNVLTILTFIGCGISYLSVIYSFFTSTAANLEKQKAQIEEAQEKMDNETAAKMMEGSVEMMQKSYDNRYILILSGLLFTTLCLIGALQMRKLKKSGYPLYVIGELVPLVLSAFLLGFGSLMSSIALAFGGVIALVFVILYSTQRKHLIY